MLGPLLSQGPGRPGPHPASRTALLGGESCVLPCNAVLPAPGLGLALGTLLACCCSSASGSVPRESIHIQKHLLDPFCSWKLTWGKEFAKISDSPSQYQLPSVQFLATLCLSLFSHQEASQGAKLISEHKTLCFRSNTETVYR